MKDGGGRLVDAVSLAKGVILVNHRVKCATVDELTNFCHFRRGERRTVSLGEERPLSPRPQARGSTAVQTPPAWQRFPSAVAPPVASLARRVQRSCAETAKTEQPSQGRLR